MASLTVTTKKKSRGRFEIFILEKTKKFLRQCNVKFFLGTSTDVTSALETILAPFHQVDPVQNLRLERNHFTFPVGWIAPIARLAPNLVFLHIPSSHLTRTDFQTICNSFANLKELIIPNTGIKSIEGIRKLKKLEVLNLRNNDVSGSESLNELSSLKRLRELIADFGENHRNQFFGVDNLLRSNEKLRLLGEDVLMKYFKVLQLEMSRENWPEFEARLNTVRNMMCFDGGAEQFILDTRRQFLVWLTEFMLLTEITEPLAFNCLHTIALLTYEQRLYYDYDVNVPELVLKAVLHIENLLDLNDPAGVMAWMVLQYDEFRNLELETEDELVDATIRTIMKLKESNQIFLFCNKIIYDRLGHMKPQQFSEICNNTTFRIHYLHLICTAKFFETEEPQLDQCFSFLMAMAKNSVEEDLEVSSYFVSMFSRLLTALSGNVQMEILILHWFNELAFSLNKKVFDQYVLSIDINPILKRMCDKALKCYREATELFITLFFHTEKWSSFNYLINDESRKQLTYYTMAMLALLESRSATYENGR